MKRRSFMAVCAAACGAAGSGLWSAAEAQEQWVTLFNGRDFTGWHVESGKLDAWKVENGMISTVKGGGGYLARDEEYADFELRLEYRLSDGGNSGVGIRFPRGGWPSTDGFEIQLLDDAHARYARLEPDHRNGAIYTHVAAKTNPSRPAGEWNRLEIRCQGPHVVARLNGVEIQNVNLDDYADSLGKGKVPLGKRPRKGLVGLQNHNDPVDFRNIEIRRL